MFVVATLFQNRFWVPAARATSKAQAEAYAEIVRNARHESVRVLTEQKWDEEHSKKRKDS